MRPETSHLALEFGIFFYRIVRNGAMRTSLYFLSSKVLHGFDLSSPDNVFGCYHIKVEPPALSSSDRSLLSK